MSDNAKTRAARIRRIGWTAANIIERNTGAADREHARAVETRVKDQEVIAEMTELLASQTSTEACTDCSTAREPQYTQHQLALAEQDLARVEYELIRRRASGARQAVIEEAVVAIQAAQIRRDWMAARLVG